MTGIERSSEAEAFLDSRQYTAPDVVSACEGWTAHEVTAHLAAAAAEITRHLRPYLAGDAVPRTRTFEEREPAYRAMDDLALQRRLEIEEAQMRAVIGQVLAGDPAAVIPWTGRTMAVAKFLPHMRNEFAVHRWDFVGDDDVSYRLLSQPELTEHAGVGPAVRVRVHDGSARLDLVSDTAERPHVQFDPAARTLFVWGRRPDRRDRVRSHVAQPDLARLQALLAGY